MIYFQPHAAILRLRPALTAPITVALKDRRPQYPPAEALTVVAVAGLHADGEDEGNELLVDDADRVDASVFYFLSNMSVFSHRLHLPLQDTLIEPSKISILPITSTSGSCILVQ